MAGGKNQPRASVGPDPDRTSQLDQPQTAQNAPQCICGTSPTHHPEHMANATQGNLRARRSGFGSWGGLTIQGPKVDKGQHDWAQVPTICGYALVRRDIS